MDDDDTEIFSQWQQIQSFPSPPTTQSNDHSWNFLLIPDHLSLLHSSHHQQPNPPSSPSSSSSHSPSPPPPPNDDRPLQDSLNRAVNDFVRHFKLPFRVLSSRILQIAKTLRCYLVCGKGFWSLVSVAGVLAAALLSLLYVRVQRWRTRIQQDKNNRRFAVLIKQKDQKITQLMLQIAQLKELLSAGRRRVPVIRLS